MRSISCGRSVGGADWASWFGGCGAAAVAGGSVMISNSLMIMGIGLLPCDIHPGTKAATGTDTRPGAHARPGTEPGPGAEPDASTGPRASTHTGPRTHAYAATHTSASAHSGSGTDTR